MSAVVAILEREIELVSRFVTVLNTEQECLTQGNADPLPAIAADKSALVDQLNALESERMAALGLPGQPSDQPSMEIWLRNNTSDRAAATAWQKLRELAHEAKVLHELNGQLVATHLKNTAEALAILTQQASQSSLYGAKGQTTSATGSRIVDSA
ncbi:MAG TPA: flagellar protein FlgN [Azonexus sp.]|nr:flagellar protein FlgN [Azonexus sp.]